MHQKQGLGPVVIVIILAVLLGGGYVAYRTLSGTNQTCWPYCPEMTDEDREDIKKQARDAYYAETYADNSHIITEYADQFIPEGGSSWKTYRNERYGFELQHPGDWHPEVNLTDDRMIVLIPNAVINSDDTLVFNLKSKSDCALLLRESIRITKCVDVDKISHTLIYTRSDNPTVSGRILLVGRTFKFTN